MIVAWTRVEEYEQISAVFSSMHTWPSQLLFEESLLDHWMVHVNSHKLRRVTFKRKLAVNVIQNLFCSFLSEASIPILGVTQELFVAAGALWSIPSTSWPRPENRRILHFKILNFPTSSSHLIPPLAAPPSPSFGSFLAIAKKMSFTFSCTETRVALIRQDIGLSIHETNHLQISQTNIWTNAGVKLHFW